MLAKTVEFYEFFRRFFNSHVGFFPNWAVNSIFQDLCSLFLMCASKYWSAFRTVLMRLHLAGPRNYFIVFICDRLKVKKRFHCIYYRWFQVLLTHFTWLNLLVNVLLRPIKCIWVHHTLSIVFRILKRFLTVFWWLIVEANIL